VILFNSLLLESESLILQSLFSFEVDLGLGEIVH